MYIHKGFIKRLLTNFLILFLFLSFIPPVLSQVETVDVEETAGVTESVVDENPPEITPPKSTQTLANENGLNTICLKGENVAEHDLSMGKLGTQRFNLVSEKAVSGVPLYIAVCTTTNGVLKCTTSNSQTDIKIFGEDNTNKVSFTTTTCKKRCNAGKTDPVINTEVPSFTVEEGNPYTPTSNKISLSIAMSGIIPHAKYPYYGFQIIPPAAVEVGRGSEIVEDYDSTIKLDVLDFSFQQTSSKTSEEECVGITWDPFGRVFDSQSLEPIEGVEVKIFDSINPEHSPLILNTSLYTDYDGVFNFMVPEGTYYLRLGNMPSTHKFIKNPNLNPNYVKIYVKQDGSSSIYSPDEPINELIDTPEEKKAGRPFVEQRDIPLDPGNNKPYKAESVKEYEEERALIMIGVGDGAKMRYSGRVSHPFARVDLVGNISQKIVASTKADRQGFFQIMVSPEIIPVDETLYIKASKTDLTTDNFDSPLSWIKKIFTKIIGFLVKDILAVESKSYEPILRYIEGYAYDSSGKPIKNAEVTVKLSMNDSSYYKTTADSKGYFVIKSNHLPPFNFYLKLTDPVTRLTVIRTTSDFVKINKKYLESESIDLMKYEPDNKNLFTKAKKNSEKEKTLQNKTDNFQNSEKQLEKMSQKNNFYNKIVLIIFFLLILLVAIVGMIVYIIKNQERNLN